MQSTFNRSVPHWISETGVLFATLALAFIVAAGVLVVVRVDAVKAYLTMIQGALGSWSALVDVFTRATPILFTGIGLTIAFRSGFANIGAEGQLVMGAIGATWVALFVTPNVAPIFVLPLMIIVGCIVASVWTIIPVILKLRGVNEVIITLMQTYIAVKFSEYLYYDAWRNPKGFGFPGTVEFPKSAWFPNLGGIHLGFFLALGMTILFWIVLEHFRWGQEVTVMGKSIRAAKYAGISVSRLFITVAILSGSLAGLAGVSELAGNTHKLQNGLAVGYGFTGIIAAYLGKLHPLGVLAASLFLAGLTVGCEQLQVSMNLPATLTLVFQGIILMFVLAAENYKQWGRRR